jgi:hypothetical protein
MFLFAIAFTGIMVTVSFMWGAFRPAQLDMEREAVTHSHQYVEARRTQILNDLEAVSQIDVDLARGSLSADAAAALRLQRGAICERVRHAAAEVPGDAVPAGVSVCH